MPVLISSKNQDSWQPDKAGLYQRGNSHYGCKKDNQNLKPQGLSMTTVLFFRLLKGH